MKRAFLLIFFLVVLASFAVAAPVASDSGTVPITYSGDGSFNVTEPSDVHFNVTDGGDDGNDSIPPVIPPEGGGVGGNDGGGGGGGGGGNGGALKVASQQQVVGGDGSFIPVCGNDLCEASEDAENCPEDCFGKENSFSIPADENGGFWSKVTGAIVGEGGGKILIPAAFVGVIVLALIAFYIKKKFI
ncbi:hypothetical protein KY343_07010 [Candidatus Woesearchaeota archaeon]|nr:hypothetical protein [Candidatus Woesearchaeota archaeon]